MTRIKDNRKNMTVVVAAIVDGNRPEVVISRALELGMVLRHFISLRRTHRRPPGDYDSTLPTDVCLAFRAVKIKPRAYPSSFLPGFSFPLQFCDIPYLAFYLSSLFYPCPNRGDVFLSLLLVRSFLCLVRIFAWDGFR